MYAEIAVNVSLGPWTSGTGAPPPTYHYRVPPALHPVVRVGQLARVPFGARPAQGVILALTETRPTLPSGTTIRPIDAITEDNPVLTPAQIALARSIAETTLSPLAETVWAMLPTGLEEKARLLIELTDAAANPPPRLGPAQTAIIHTLKHSGPLPQDRLLAQAGVKSSASLAGLVERGLVRKRWQLEPPGVRPRTVRFVRLTASPDEVATARPTLGRDTPEALALAWLAASPDPLPAQAELFAAADITPGRLRRLEEDGLVGLTRKRTLVHLRARPGEVKTVMSALRSPHQARLLQALLDARTPLDLSDLREQDIPTSALTALEAKALVRRVEELPSVYLTIPLADVPEALLQLRDGATQAAALDYLLRHGPEVEAAALQAAIGASADDLRLLAERGLVEIEDKQAWRDPLAGQSFVLTKAPRLTEDQQRVWLAIEPAFAGLDEAQAFLLHGVTGSGKTEIYLRGVEAALARGRQALILVPEISLTPQTVRRFAARFPGRVTVWHSRLTPRQRYDNWQRVRAGEVDVVVGSRSALFAPLPRLGLVVVDEEHDPSYKQDTLPRYHAREVALTLGRLTGSPVVLGSATPDVETYARAERGEIALLQLPRRVLGHRHAVAEQVARLGLTETPALHTLGDLDAIYTDLPPVQVVDLRAELRAGNTSIFSRALQAALAETLSRRQQAILFLNRRGAATIIMCRTCGHVLACPRCSAALTYHTSTGSLVCHHCGLRAEPPTRCPQCNSERIRHFGAGTQRVEEAVRAFFPQARILRWDLDTTGKAGAHADYLDQFIHGDADVLVGTQMIAKGLDLPLVTLVGIVSADVGLHLPDFRTAERSFQLLTQVAGRAARGPLGGRVILQTYTPEHYAVQSAARHDYESFYAAEMAFRRAADYPPFGRLARLLYLDPTWDRARAEAERLARRLIDFIRRRGLANTGLIGPAPAYFGRERGEYRWHIVVRNPDPAALLHAFFETETPPYGWRVDIDPVSLL